MKLEVGMYVRTKNGNIRKIVELTNTKFIDKPDYYVDKVLIDIEQNEREDTIYMEKWLFNEDIVKSSPNIIDIIEVGDYVNGEQVRYIEEGTDYRVLAVDEDYTYIIAGYDCDGFTKPINSIVTKEQFESMKYEVK